jgi:hypothetical protein
MSRVATIAGKSSSKQQLTPNASGSATAPTAKFFECSFSNFRAGRGRAVLSGPRSTRDLLKDRRERQSAQSRLLWSLRYPPLRGADFGNYLLLQRPGRRAFRKGTDPPGRPTLVSVRTFLAPRNSEAPSGRKTVTFATLANVEPWTSHSDPSWNKFATKRADLKRDDSKLRFRARTRASP